MCLPVVSLKRVFSMKFDEKCNYDLVFSILSSCLATYHKPMASVLLQHIVFLGETLHMDSESFYAGGYSTIEKSVTIPLLQCTY